MINILYIDTLKNKCNYYNDIIKYLKKYSKLRIMKDTEDINFVLKKFNANIIIIGFGLTNSGYDKPNFKISKKIKIPVYIILNKEYAGLDNKLQWIKSLQPKKVFTVHHHYKIFEKKINVQFIKIMWSADHEIFKKYDNIYKYDLFFSGIIRTEQTYNMRYKIYKKLHELQKYKNFINAGFYNTPKIKNHKLCSTLEYAKRLNHSKIVLTTTGPADLVGTRYFEIMASNKAMILCNRMSKNIYSDIVIDKFNCIMFDDENDFIKKCTYYLENEDERIKIVNNAYKYFLDKHTWDHKVKYLLANL